MTLPSYSCINFEDNCTPKSGPNIIFVIKHYDFTDAILSKRQRIFKHEFSLVCNQIGRASLIEVSLEKGLVGSLLK